jgi:hypothetical protein
MQIQTIAYAASITPDIALGDAIEVGTLTGNITINNAANVQAGAPFLFLLRTDSTARTLTWGANYRIAADSLRIISASARVIVQFFPVSATLYYQDGNPVETAI